MAAIFWDSFNHYGASLIPKWDFPFGGSIINNSAIARTGPRCCQILGAGGLGPAKNIGTGLQVVQYTQLIQGLALNWDAISSNIDCLVFGLVGDAVQVANVIITVNTDGSISAFKGAGDTGRTLLGTSATKPFAFNPTPTVSGLWNYLECKVTISRTVGTVEIRFAPPTGPMAVILTLTAQNTAALVAAQFCNQIQVDGPGGLAQHAYVADYYCSDWSDGSSYLGGVKIYHDMPFANGSPVQWTPSAGQNWSNVNEVPPDGLASFNGGAAVGLTDQYQHNFGQVPIGSQIMGVQHVMDIQTDTGARAVTSVAGGIVNPNTVYLSNGFGMYTFPYVQNTKTGKNWVLADFPFQFGPQVIA